MAKRNRVLKASDVFQRQSPFFGAKSTFEDVFPQVSRLTVKVDFGYDYYLGPMKARYDAKSLPGEFIDCRNPHCFGGGFSIGAILREMTYACKTKYEDVIYCRGYEGSPKGRRRYRSCDASFKITVEIQYKDTLPATQ